MKIYFDDPEYDGQFLRSVDYAPVGAQIAGVGDCRANHGGRHNKLV